MTFSKQSERIALLLGIMHGLAGIVLYVLGERLQAHSLWALGIVHVSGIVVSLLAWVYGALIRLADEETNAREQLEADRGKLFEEGAGAGERHRALMQFERFGAGGAALLLIVIEGGLAFILTRLATRAAAEGSLLGLGAATTLIVIAFAFFLTGKYAAALAAESDDTHGTLRAPAGITLLTAGLLLLSGIVHMVHYAFREVETAWLDRIDIYLTRVLLAIVVLLILENIVGIILSIYRPVRPGERKVPAYESRLAGLLVRPGSFIQNLSEMLDYQFGFQISETWFMRLITRALLPLCLLQVVILIVLSCLAFVNPGERAILEHWGRPTAKNLSPGFHAKWPWPIERVFRFKSDRLRQFTIGIDNANVTENGSTQFWSDLTPGAPIFVAASKLEDTDSSSDKRQQSQTLTTPSATLLAAEVTVLYYLKDIRNFEYDHAQPVKLLKSLARREALRTFASHDGFTLLEEDREQLAGGLSQRLQKIVDQLDLGITIASVGVGRLQPPAGVVPAFHEVLAQRQERETARLKAEQYRHQSVPKAEVEATELLSQAKAYRAERVDSSQAFADIFSLQRQVFRDYHQFFTIFAYLDRLERAVSDARKIVVATDLEDQVFSMDFKENPQAELLDFSGE